MTIGDKIRLQRKTLGLTQTELGTKLGVKTNAVSKWECGRVEDIPMSKVKAMATLFNVPTSYLIDEEKPTLISEDGSGRNMIKITGRDGSMTEKYLTDEQIKAVRAMVEMLPDADDL